MSEAFRDYSRVKAMREVKAIKLLQLFESGKLKNFIEDVVYDYKGTYPYEEFKDVVEDYLNVE